MDSPIPYTHAVHSISDDKENWSNLIKEIPFGVLTPGVSAVKTLYLATSGAACDRIIDISIQSRNTAVESPTASPTTPKSPASRASDTGETLRTLVVPTIVALSVESSVSYTRSRKATPPLAELSTYDDECLEGFIIGDVFITTTWRCLGPHALMVESVKLIPEVRRALYAGRPLLTTFLAGRQTS